MLVRHWQESKARWLGQSHAEEPSGRGALTRLLAEGYLLAGRVDDAAEREDTRRASELR
jgi:hypothetical protein